MIEKILSLHKYWIYADKMRILFRKAVKENQEEISSNPVNPIESRLQAHSLMLGNFGIFKAFWYSSLYIVVEGYLELKLALPDVDKLLTETKHLDKLRLFRNGTFHYQKQTYNEKILGVDQTDEFVEWIYNLHSLLGKEIIKAGMKEFSADSQERIKTRLNGVFGEEIYKKLTD